jgi:predicted ATPase
MMVSHITIKNWRNFRTLDVALSHRVFLVGPNASGKSNFLDVFRFLRDIVKPGGGLQKSVSDRGGLSKLRCLSAREHPVIEIDVSLSETPDRQPTWRYAIGLKQEPRGYRNPLLGYEKVWKENQLIVSRPNAEDKKDPVRLTQTFLEQINANSDFRDIAKYLESIIYLHLIPQLLRYPDAFPSTSSYGDPYGRNFLDRVSQAPKNILHSRLKKIETALRIAVPQLKELTLVKDEHGFPHLQAIYEHWRPQGAKQREDQFSDGTLRLLGLLWSLLEGDSLLLLEEPELSLNAGIVSRLPALMHRLQRSKKRQIILSTHSEDLLKDKSIGGEEILLLTPGPEGTQIASASSIKEIKDLLEGGLSAADAILPRTVPSKIDQLDLFE